MLSKKTKELLDLITGKTPAVGKGQKLIIGDGPARLAEDTVAFVKSMTEKPTVARALAARGTIAHVAKVGGSADLDCGFEKLAKRAPHVPITEAEMQGATPSVAPAGKPRGERGLSDADLQALEQEITSGNPGIAPAQAAKLFMETYRVIAANPARRLTTESDAYGTPAVPSGYTN